MSNGDLGRDSFSAPESGPLPRVSAGRRRGRRAVRRFALASLIESLECRSMMAADLQGVAQVIWNGSAVNAVRDEFVLRMPQTNAATAKSTLDYACARPAVPAGWTASELGYGFFNLKAPGATAAQVQGWAARQGVKTLEPNIVTRTVAGTTATAPLGQSASGLMAITGTPAPSDPRLADQWGLRTIGVPNAWQRTTGASSVVVAVLDDGVDYTHEDLRGNMWVRPTSIPRSVVGTYGYDFANRDDDPNPEGAANGTAVAGIIGAVGNNGKGVTGVAQTVQIFAAKVASRGSVTTASTIAAMSRLAVLKNTYGVNIVAANANYLRIGAPDAVESQAIQNLGAAGIMLVAAAGDANRLIDEDPAPYPASYDLENVISVAASTRADAKAGYSNFGGARVVMAAPGGDGGVMDAGDIVTTLPGNRYGYVSGTGMAASYVTGAIALLKTLRRDATTAEIRAALIDGAAEGTLASTDVQDGRRLQVDDAMQRLVSAIPAPGAADPSATFAAGQATGVLEGNTGYTFAEVKVQLDRAPSSGKTCSVWYTTVPGTASANSDFVAQSGYLTFSGTQTEQVLRVRVIGDRSVENDETFTVRLDPTRSKGMAAGFAAATQSVSIVDDDGTATPSQPGGTNPTLPAVSVALKSAAGGTAGGTTNQAPTVSEGSTATFVVSLSSASSKPVTVRFRTTEPVTVPTGTATAGVDYQAVSGTLTFRPGETTKEFDVQILADTVDDVGETFRVVLSEPVNAVLGGGGGAGNAAGASGVTVTIGGGSTPAPASGFTITVTFPDSSLNAAQQAVFLGAAARWQEIIVGDLPDATDPATGQPIDDVLIVATAPAIDGRGGVLGQAGPTNTRGGRGLPFKGRMQFDSADVGAMVSNGTFQDVILHEMGHVLGFGTLWQRFGLVQGLGTSSPNYTGVNALREYRTIFGVPNVPGVPVENTGGQGTAGGHWRESFFDTELMTGYAEPAGTRMPISRITVGSLQDLGYTVDYSKADPYTMPLVAGRASPGSTVPGLQAAAGQMFMQAGMSTGTSASDIFAAFAPWESASSGANSRATVAARRTAFAALARTLPR